MLSWIFTAFHCIISKGILSILIYKFSIETIKIKFYIRCEGYFCYPGSAMWIIGVANYQLIYWVEIVYATSNLGSFRILLYYLYQIWLRLTGIMIMCFPI
jgi:hypothetical protein